MHRPSTAPPPPAQPVPLEPLSGWLFQNAERACMMVGRIIEKASIRSTFAVSPREITNGCTQRMGT